MLKRGSSSIFEDIEAIIDRLQFDANNFLRIALASDEVGNVVSKSGSVTSDNNTTGLEVSLNKGMRSLVNVYYNVGGAAEIYVEVSVDGTTWRAIDKIVTTGAREDIEVYPWLIYPYIRVRTPTTGISVEFEIVAGR